MHLLPFYDLKVQILRFFYRVQYHFCLIWGVGPVFGHNDIEGSRQSCYTGKRQFCINIEKCSSSSSSIDGGSSPRASVSLWHCKIKSPLMEQSSNALLLACSHDKKDIKVKDWSTDANQTDIQITFNCFKEATNPSITYVYKHVLRWQFLLKWRTLEKSLWL